MVFSLLCKCMYDIYFVAIKIFDFESLNPAWCEATYSWLTDNCPLTNDLWILETLSYINTLPMAIFATKVSNISTALIKNWNKLKLISYSPAYIAKNLQED